MNPHWRKALLTVAIVAAVALPFWPMAGKAAALGVGCLLLAGLLAHHLHNLSQFQAWLLAPGTENVPTGSGSWEQCRQPR